MTSLLIHLTPKQRALIEHYVVFNGNALKAARIAGYTKTSARCYVYRFLRRPDIQREIKAHLEQHKGQRLEQEFQQRKTKRTQKDTGYVYFVQAPNGLIKIGKAQDVRQRVRNLNCMMPFELKVLFVLKTPKYHELEKYFHHRFKKRRVRYEWFALSENDFCFISASPKRFQVEFVDHMVQFAAASKK